MTWARSSAGYTISDIAQFFGKSDDVIVAWESGEDSPTIRQLEKFANKVKRPLATLFLPSPPVEPPMLEDYRVLPDRPSGEFEPDTLLAFRRARNTMILTAELMEELGTAISVKLPYISLNDDPEKKASELRSYLGVSFDEQLKWKSTSKAVNNWRDILFDFGVIVLQFTISVGDARGFSILSDELAAIGLSTKDTIEARHFSLFHELCHLCLHRPGVSGGEIATRSEICTPQARLEKYCDKFSASFLLPKESDYIGSTFRYIVNDTGCDDSEVKRIAQKLKVSKYVLLRRLLETDYIDDNNYWGMYNRWIKIDKQISPKKKLGGGPHYVDRQVGERGKRLVSLVFEALDGGYITMHDATSYLSLEPKWFDRARESTHSEAFIELH